MRFLNPLRFVTFSWAQEDAPIPIFGALAAAKIVYYTDLDNDIESLTRDFAGSTANSIITILSGYTGSELTNYTELRHDGPAYEAELDRYMEEHMAYIDAKCELYHKECCEMDAMKRQRVEQWVEENIEYAVKPRVVFVDALEYQEGTKTQPRYIEKEMDTNRRQRVEEWVEENFRYPMRPGMVFVDDLEHQTKQNKTSKKQKCESQEVREPDSSRKSVSTAKSFFRWLSFAILFWFVCRGVQKEVEVLWLSDLAPALQCPAVQRVIGVVPEVVVDPEPIELNWKDTIDCAMGWWDPICRGPRKRWWD